MAPAWEKLTEAFDGHETALVAEVDCTGDDSKPLCEQNGVQGFPTLKYGNPSALEDYEGGRDFDALKKFADENLKPICGVNNLDLCEEEVKIEIDALMAMDLGDMDKIIEEMEVKIQEAEDHFTTEIDNLQNAYKKLTEDKQNAIKAVKDSGLGRLKSVRAYKVKNAKEDKMEL